MERKKLYRIVFVGVLAAMVYVVQAAIQAVKGMAEQLDRLNVVKNKIRGLYESENMAVEVTDMIY